MDAALTATLARVILYLHFLVVAFNIAGLILIPLGAACGWSFLRIYWLRVAHLTVLFVVAAQALLGRYCFLTLWQAVLEEAVGGVPGSRLDRIVSAAIYWPLPFWAFIVLYLAALVFTLWLWRLVPPERKPAL